MNFKALLSGQGIFRRGANAAIWSVAAKLGARALRLGSNLVLTRLLAPEAFGLMAAASLMVAMIELFSDFGIKTAIVQNPRGDSREFLDTAWVISIFRGLLLGAATLLCAYPAAEFFQRPDLSILLFWLALTPVLSGLENPAVILFVKKLKPLPRFFIEFGGEAAGILGSIGLAFVFSDVRALIGGVLVRSVFRLCASYLVCDFMPRFRPHREALNELFRFGKFILLNTLITWAAMNLDRLAIGRALGMESLGLYSIGRNLGMMAELLLIQACMNSYFPIQCGIQGDEKRVANIYRITTWLIVPATAFALTMIACFSREITQFLYDPRYAGTALVLSMFALRGIIRAIGILQGATLTARGKPGLETIASTAGLLLLLPGLLLAANPEYAFGGLDAMQLTGLAIIACALGASLVESFFLMRNLNFSALLTWRPYLLAGTSALIAWALSSELRTLLTPLFGGPAL